MQHSIQNDANGPKIYFIAMAISSIEYLWCKIVWSSTDCPLAFTLIENLSCKSKISDFETHALS